MMRSKSIRKYYDVILHCLSKKYRKAVFVGDKFKDFNNVSDILINNNIDFTRGYDNRIMLKNGSIIDFNFKNSNESKINLVSID